MRPPTASAFPALLALADFSGQIRWGNEAWETFFGAGSRPDDPRPPRLTTCIHPDDRQEAIEQLRQLATGGPVQRCESRFRREDGVIRWLLWSAQSVEGGLVAIAAQDITSRRRVEQAVRHSARRLAKIVQLAEDAILIADENEEIVFVNPAVENLFGYQTHELLGQPLRLLLPVTYVREQYKKLRTAFAVDKQESLRERAGTYRRLLVETRDGQQFPIEASVSKTVVDGSLLATVILRDNTEQDWAERALLEANAQLKESNRRARELAEMAEAANQAKSTFLANMSHEIRTPLNAILGFGDLLQDTPLTAAQQQYVQMMRDSGESLLTLINDMLDFSKIEAGRLTLEKEPFSLREVVEAALDVVAVKANDKGLDLAYHLAESVPSVIIGDAARLQQILVNLLGNAVKFTEVGEVAVNVAATPAGASAEETVSETGASAYELQVAVRDTGIGLSLEQANQIFEPFSQAESYITRKYGGTGLGLAISRRLAEEMGGRMWVESAGPGRGSTFFFTIQVRASGRAISLGGGSPCVGGPVQALEGRRLLLVDGNETRRRMVTACTQSWGLETVSAATVAEGVAHCRHDPDFQLILLASQQDAGAIQKTARQLRAQPSAQNASLLALVPFGQEKLAGDTVAATLHKPLRAEALYHALLQLTQEAGRPGAAAGHRPDASFAQRHPLSILVAEDNAINQRLMLQILSQMGYAADLATDGTEVLAALRRRPYDLVLMDVRMPRMDGLETTRQIRAEWPAAEQPRIVAVTASALTGERERFLAAGMDGYLGKPLRREALQRVLAGATPATLTEQMPKTDPADAPLDQEMLHRLYDVVGEQREVFKEVIEDYLEKADKRVEGMQTALVNGDAHMLAFEAHSFKAISASLGALHLATLCGRIEKLAESWSDPAEPGQGRALLAAQLQKLEAELGLVREALVAELERGPQ